MSGRSLCHWFSCYCLRESVYFFVFFSTNEVFMSGECHRILRYWYHYAGGVDVVSG